MKKSLILSDKDRYPNGPTPVGAENKPKERKTAPTITLTGKQVDAFCGCEMKPGDTGSATVHFVVKAASAGDQYGDDLPTGKSADKKLTLALTHVESDEEGDDEDESLEDPKEEKDETPEEETAEEKDEPAAPKRDTLSPKDALGDDE